MSIRKIKNRLKTKFFTIAHEDGSVVILKK